MPPILIVEIKARTTSLDDKRRILESLDARFVGRDRQVDTYFRCSEGRLKLRRGNVENALIRYRRPNQAGPKKSAVLLEKLPAGNVMGEILSEVLETDVVVDKTREIWFVDNVKIHLDEVQGLGRFMEIEAIDETGTVDPARLDEQCRHFMDLFGIREGDLVTHSYSDLVRSQGATPNADASHSSGRGVGG